MVKRFTDFDAITAAGLTANDVLVGAEVEGNTNFKLPISEALTLFGGAGGGTPENVIEVEDTGDPEDNGQVLLDARDAAVSGDLIVVHPGVYTLPLSDHQLGRNGVNYHFEAGVTVQLDDVTTSVAQANRITGFFDDSAQGQGLNADLVCRITGNAKFRWRIAPTTVVEGPGMFRLTRSGSNIHLEFDEIILDEAEPPINAHYYYVFSTTEGTLFARGNYAYRQSYVPIVWWTNGNTFIDVNHIRGVNTTSAPGFEALSTVITDKNTGATPTGSLWIRSQLIEGHVVSTGTGKHANATTWIECQLLRGAMVQTGGKLYVKCQKWLLEFAAANYGISQLGGILWLETDKVTAGITTLVDNDSIRGYAELGGDSYINVRQWEDLGLSDINTGELKAIHVFAGTHHITSQVLSVTTPSGQGDLANPGYAVAVSAGTLHWNGRVQSTDANCRGFLVSGTGVLIINQASCVLTGSTNSLYAASSKDVYLYGTLATNKDKHANITIVGDTAGFVFSASVI